MEIPQAWAVVLAGGDGLRLRRLTRRLSGDERPKQFCRLYGGKTLLAHARTRLAPVISPDRTVFVLVKSHQRFYGEDLGDVSASRLVIQPSNKGTVAAIVYGLMRVRSLDPDPLIAFFPTDHHYSNEPLFIASLRVALQAAAARPDRLILLGADAEDSEVEYGWIEPGSRLESAGTDALFEVARFWEKPTAPVARVLLAGGCLWNTFVMLGRASLFLRLTQSAAPHILRPFLSIQPRSSGEFRPGAAEALYASLPTADFSSQVLSRGAPDLALLRIGNVGWSDLGTPERVRSALGKSELDFHAANREILGAHPPAFEKRRPLPHPRARESPAARKPPGFEPWLAAIASASSNKASSQSTRETRAKPRPDLIRRDADTSGR